MQPPTYEASAKEVKTSRFRRWGSTTPAALEPLSPFEIPALPSGVTAEQAYAAFIKYLFDKAKVSFVPPMRGED